MPHDIYWFYLNASDLIASLLSQSLICPFFYPSPFFSFDLSLNSIVLCVFPPSSRLLWSLVLHLSLLLHPLLLSGNLWTSRNEWRRNWQKRWSRPRGGLMRLTWSLIRWVCHPHYNDSRSCQTLSVTTAAATQSEALSRQLTFWLTRVII